MFKGDIDIIDQCKSKAENINIWEYIWQIINDFKHDYGFKIHSVGKMTDNYNMLYISFKNDFALYFNQYSSYICMVEYCGKDIEDFKNKVLYIKKKVNEIVQL